VPALLRAYEFTGDALFRDQALAFLEGWAEYAYDPQSGSFWGSLELDGTPVPGPWAASGYPQFEPRGLIDLWAPEFITAQYNPDAAKSYAQSYQALGDPDLLDTAKKWAALIRDSLPATDTLDETWYATYSSDWAQHGTYAEHYGHIVDFFATLYEETGEAHYLLSARTVAQEAIAALWFEGMFRGHPNKPYFEAVDGVGVLLEALIDLDAQSANFTKFGDFDGNGVVDGVDYQTMQTHWLTSVALFENGDVTGDGFVSLEDFSRFKNDFFEGNRAALGGGSNLIPEPRTLWLALVGLALLRRQDAGGHYSPWRQGVVQASQFGRSRFPPVPNVPLKRWSCGECRRAVGFNCRQSKGAV